MKTSQITIECVHCKKVSIVPLTKKLLLSLIEKVRTITKQENETTCPHCEGQKEVYMWNYACWSVCIQCDGDGVVSKDISKILS